MDTEQTFDYRSNLNGKTLAEKILLQPSTSCCLTIPVYQPNSDSVIITTYPFYMSDGLALGFSNQWKDLVDITDNAFLEAYNKVNSLRGTGIAHVTPQSEAMSNKIWSGSKFNGFNIRCLFIATNRKINTLEILTNICSTCLPTKLKNIKNQDADTLKGAATMVVGAVGKVAQYVGDGAKVVADMIFTGDLKDQANNFLNKYKNDVSNLTQSSKALIEDAGLAAPLQYGLSTDAGGLPKPIKNTTVSLHIGEYFKADELLVTDISNVKTSKEIIAPSTDNTKKSNSDLYDSSAPAVNAQGGFPLYVELSMSLIPASLLTLEKFRGYFTTAQNNGILNTLGIQLR